MNAFVSRRELLLPFLLLPSPALPLAGVALKPAGRQQQAERGLCVQQGLRMAPLSTELSEGLHPPEPPPVLEQMRRRGYAGP